MKTEIFTPKLEKIPNVRKDMQIMQKEVYIGPVLGIIGNNLVLGIEHRSRVI